MDEESLWRERTGEHLAERRQLSAVRGPLFLSRRTGIAAAAAGKALVDDDCARKAVAELTRE